MDSSRTTKRNYRSITGSRGMVCNRNQVPKNSGRSLVIERTRGLAGGRHEILQMSVPEQYLAGENTKKKNKEKTGIKMKVKRRAPKHPALRNAGHGPQTLTNTGSYTPSNKCRKFTFSSVSTPSPSHSTLLTRIIPF